MALLTKVLSPYLRLPHNPTLRTWYLCCVSREPGLPRVRAIVYSRLGRRHPAHLVSRHHAWIERILDAAKQAAEGVWR